MLEQLSMTEKYKTWIDEVSVKPENISLKPKHIDIS